MFCKLTGDLPEAMDKGWQGRTALLRSLIRERTRALHRYSLWDAAIWEKSRLAIIRENNSSWSQHCQSRNYPLTQWHWLRLLATFIKFGAVTQGLSLVTVVFIGVTEPCPQDRTQLCQATYKHTTKRKSWCTQKQGQNLSHYLHLSYPSCASQHLSYRGYLPASYQ